ncbi:hypothetical protein ABBQ32_002095 [Trebouxia sp. C0010 RCD-2024]
MVTTRRGRTTAVDTPDSPKAKAKASPKKAGTTGAGSVTTKDQRKRQGKKRSVAEAVDEVNGTAEDPPKRQKNVENGATKADLQVKSTEPNSLEEMSAIPEVDIISAAAAMDPPVGSETALSAEDLAPTPTAPTEEAKPDVNTAQEMPVEEAVKMIGGTQAGSAPVSTVPTAETALDAVPVGPDPAAAGKAADDSPQDGDYFLDANLADSMLEQEDSKPVEQSQGATANTNTGFLAPPAAGSGPPSVAEGGAGQTGMAAEAGNAPTDVPSGIQPDASAVQHTEPTGASDAMHAPITQVPSTADAHDSHFGAAALQDANDIPAIFGGDNA